MAQTFDQLPSNVMAALQRGNQIEAIKLLREATGLGLKEAKDVIDHYANRGPAAPTIADALSSALGALPPDVINAWKQGNKIEAIKLLRARGGAGLSEARKAIEAFERQQHAGGGAQPMDKPKPDAVAVMVEQRRKFGGRTLSPGEVSASTGRGWLIVLLAVIVVAVGYWLFVA